MYKHINLLMVLVATLFILMACTSENETNDQENNTTVQSESQDHDDNEAQNSDSNETSTNDSQKEEKSIENMSLEEMAEKSKAPDLPRSNKDFRQNAEEYKVSTEQLDELEVVYKAFFYLLEKNKPGIVSERMPSKFLAEQLASDHQDADDILEEIIPNTTKESFDDFHNNIEGEIDSIELENMRFSRTVTAEEAKNSEDISEPKLTNVEAQVNIHSSTSEESDQYEVSFKYNEEEDNFESLGIGKKGQFK